MALTHSIVGGLLCLGVLLAPRITAAAVAETAPAVPGLVKVLSSDDEPLADRISAARSL
jgi:hypothetical protein